MPSYVHTCEHCGAHMQVHERYLGRTLRCTSCRAEFLAELPADVEVAEADPEPLEDRAQDRTRSRIAVWVVVILVPLAVLVWWLGQAPRGGIGGDLFRAQRSIGEMASLARDGKAPVIVALDRGTVEVLVKADSGAAESVLATGHGLEVAAGTQIRVLERANRGRELRVRILSGPWQGRIVWVPARWVR